MLQQVSEMEPQLRSGPAREVFFEKMNAPYVKGEKELLIYAFCAEDISRRLQKKLVRVVPSEEDTCRAEGLEWKLGLCPLIPLDLLLLCTCSLVESISQLRLNCQIRNSN